MTTNKPKPELLGMAADMELARQELYGLQLERLEARIKVAKDRAQYDMSAPTVTIDLRPRWKIVPAIQAAQEPTRTKRSARPTLLKQCPHCGVMFQRLKRHLNAGCGISTAPANLI